MLHTIANVLVATTMLGVPTDTPPAKMKATLRLVDEAAKPLPCRVHLQGLDGQPVRPDGLPFWKDHFCCDGTVELQVPPGRYHYEIERGPEYESLRGEWEISSAEESELTLVLKRLTDLAQLGWYSGDLHVHRPVNDVPLLLAAEDLRIAPVITWWNARNPWSETHVPETTLHETPDGRFYDVMAGEDERGGGALLYFGLREPLGIADADREHPSSSVFLERAKKLLPDVWVDVEKPFWRDVPLWLASGQVDSIGIAHNHLWRRGVLDNEAWGRPRDVEQWPGPPGNGRWTQEIYYHALNCGLRIPPSAGSASGVLPNPVGYNRCYVHVNGPLTYPSWWEGLRAGRVFVTNGPLLLVTANEQLPGHVFQAEQSPLRLTIQGRVISREPIAQIEVIRDGRVVEKLPGSKQLESPFATGIEYERSGWFLIRAIADNSETFRFASTGPFYVEIGGQKRHIDRRSARFFRNWAEERRAELASLLDAPQRTEVLPYHDRAVAFWTELIERAD